MKIMPDESPLPYVTPSGVNIQPSAVPVASRNIHHYANSAPFPINKQQQQWQRPTEAVDYCRSSDQYLQQQQQQQQPIPTLHQQSYNFPSPEISSIHPIPAPPQQSMMSASNNMNLQFMYAMQKSVTQVINAPHFGFEWVKPDYRIDEAIIASVSIPGINGDDDDDEEEEDLSSSDEPVLLKAEQLTQHEMQDLFHQLEEFVSTVDGNNVI